MTLLFSILLGIAIAYPISRWLIGKTLRISPRSRPMVRLFSSREARKRIRKMRKA